MPQHLSRDAISAYQNLTFHLTDEKRLHTPKDAIDFVNERGFVFFWPVKGTRFPSLWSGVAGDRPVADDHEDPGHITWSWKDSLLDKRVWYYARVLKKKNGFISHEALPYFYALSPNYGEPEADLKDQYDQGLLPLEVKLVFEALLKNGPLDTLSLRKESHLSGAASQSPFNHALEILQMQFKVLPVATCEAGAWKYAFVYDLTHNYYPDLIERTRYISDNAAYEKLLTLYARTMGVFQVKEVTSFFGWHPGQLDRPLSNLVKSGSLQPVSVEGSTAEHFCTKELII